MRGAVGAIVLPHPGDRPTRYVARLRQRSRSIAQSAQSAQWSDGQPKERPQDFATCMRGVVADPGMVSIGVV
jgi:hypothetical protein